MVAKCALQISLLSSHEAPNGGVNPILVEVGVRRDYNKMRVRAYERKGHFKMMMCGGVVDLETEMLWEENTPVLNDVSPVPSLQNHTF
jgi:hypothetical protein